MISCVLKSRMATTPCCVAAVAASSTSSSFDSDHRRGAPEIGLSGKQWALLRRRALRDDDDIAFFRATADGSRFASVSLSLEDEEEVEEVDELDTDDCSEERDDDEEDDDDEEEEESLGRCRLCRRRGRRLRLPDGCFPFPLGSSVRRCRRFPLRLDQSESTPRRRRGRGSNPLFSSSPPAPSLPR